jgi:ribosomal protein S10
MTDICINLNSFHFLYIEKAKKKIFNTIAFLDSLSYPYKKKDVNLIKSSIQDFKLLKAESKDLAVINSKKLIIPLPISRNKLTILRSPHIDKKSREQFERLRHKLRIQLGVKNSLKTYLFLTFLKSLKIPGVEITISLRFYTFFPYVPFSKH